MAHIERIIEIHAPADVAYQAWRRLERFPLLSESIQRVDGCEDGTRRWLARGLFGKRAEWTAKICEEPGQRRINWEFNRGSISLEGRVDFIPAEGGCVARVLIDYRPPLGWVGEFIAETVWDLEMKVDRDLERLKSAIERPVRVLARNGATNEREDKPAVRSLAVRL